MNASVGLAGDPAFARNSLILTGGTFRTFCAVVSECARPFAVHDALPLMSPLNAAGPEVTLKLAFTLAPGATGPGMVTGAPLAHPLGTARLNFTPVTGAPVVFVNVKVLSCAAPGVNVC